LSSALCKRRRTSTGAIADCDTQGSVYQQIIDKVVQASQNDFEEFGVDHSTLDEMKQVCDSLAATRLSHLSFSRGYSAQPLCSFLRRPSFFSSRSICCSVVCAACDSAAMQPGLGGHGRPKAGLSCRLSSQVGGALSIWVTSYSPCSAAQPRQAKAITAQHGIARHVTAAFSLLRIPHMMSID
jgi:hypothetical protein